MLLLAGCDLLSTNESTNDYVTKTVGGDYSEIVDPRARWEAYGLEDYTIEQTRICECSPPYMFTVVVMDGEVAEVLYDLSEKDEAGPSSDYETVLANAMTVDSLFDMIEHETPTAAHVEVEYHSKYGCPTKVNIDRDERMADEEIIRSLANLREVVE